MVTAAIILKTVKCCNNHLISMKTRKRRNFTKRYRRNFTKRYRRRNPSALVSIVLIVFSLLVMMMVYHENQKKLRTPVISNLVEHDYDFSNLYSENGFILYEDDTYTSIPGIDVSSHQGAIDWKKVKEAGVQFAYIRCGYRGYETGLINKDETFDYNISQAKANGIQVGVYFFSQAVSQKEAEEEAEFTLSCMKKYEIDLPVVYDFEKPGGIFARTYTQSKDVTTENAVLFCHIMQRKGYDAMIYNSTNLFEKLFNLEYIQEFGTWVAHYNTPYPTYPYTYQIWQYSDSGKIDGIDQAVDLDLMFIRK